jgi:hypothetical protein
MMTLAILMLAASACKKDEVAAPTSSFTVDGASKNLKSAALLYATTSETSGTGKTYYRTELLLMSEGLTISGTKATGKGDAIDLFINGASQKLDEGTYTFTNTGSNPEPLQISKASIYINYDSITELGDQLKFTALNMTVTKSGDTYTIAITGTAGGKAIVGQYIGTVTNVSK